MNKKRVKIEKYYKIKLNKLIKTEGNLPRANQKFKEQMPALYNAYWKYNTKNRLKRPIKKTFWHRLKHGIKQAFSILWEEMEF